MEAPVREPIRWQEDDYWDPKSLYDELERVYDICHGCRRCVNLCEAFPTLFDLVDESDTMEVDGVDQGDYMQVVEQCYLCDLCAETKCPYLPPHEWAVDFPHLMLRAKAQKFRAGESKWRDRVFSSADGVMGALGVPGVAQTVNAMNRNKVFRKLVAKSIGFHAEAPMPVLHSRTFKHTMTGREAQLSTPSSCPRTTGRVAFFTTCYGNRIEPQISADMMAVFEHNGIAFKILQSDRCCGMPKLEIGDIQAVTRQKEHNIPGLLEAIADGYDLIAPIPSCTLMFKQEIPLLFPKDEEVRLVKERFFDPFEYLHLRHKAGLMNTDFRHSPGHVAYQVACHQRVQNIGLKTRDVLQLIPDVRISLIERCSGHDGSYALRLETHEQAMKIAKPTVNKIKKANADVYASDCPMAGRLLAQGMADGSSAAHPISLLRQAYGI